MIQCPYCPQRYKNSAHIHHHIAAHHPQEKKKFVCVYCGTPFTNKRHLSEHEHHCPKQLKNIAHPEIPISPAPIYSCPKCAKFYTRPISLGSHIRWSHPELVKP